MNVTPSEISVRATALADANTGATCIVVHRRDLMFDLPALNRQENRAWRVLPASTAHGVSWDELAAGEELLVDATVLDCLSVRVFDSNDPLRTIDSRSLRHARIIRHCQRLHRTTVEVSPEEKVENAITTFTGRRVRQRLDETLDIPPLPAAAQRIIALKANPDYALIDLVKVVETDPSIAAKVMSWAGSAFYGADPPPRSLSDAIMRVLGFDIVMNLALGLALAGTLRLPAHQVSGMPPYWTEAVFTAAAMEALTRRQSNDGGDRAGIHYLTGLLANFGTLVIGHVFPPQYEALCQLQAANPDLPVNDLDEHVLTLSRELLAAELFSIWGLPALTVTAVRHQNNSAYSGEHAGTVRLLQTARALLGYGGHALTGIDSGDLHAIGIVERDLTEVSSLLLDSRDALEGLARAVA